MRRSIDFLQLDLSGLTVLTEAASGPYVVTPVIACLAGAGRVLALTRDTRYASSQAVMEQTRALEALSDAPVEASIYTQRSPELFAQADVVTNLGFVRPIDGNAIAAMKANAVISLMCEAWELRPGDVDLPFCGSKGIKVGATNEGYPGLDIFSYSAWLCLKMLFEAQIETHQCKIVVVSSDKFGTTIERLLGKAGVEVMLLKHLRGLQVRQILAGADALVIADYTRRSPIIGEQADIEPAVLGKHFPSLTIVHFAGVIDVQGLAHAGVVLHPAHAQESHRMAMTLASLGPAPVIKLHAAGLKVAELLARKPPGSDRFRNLIDPVPTHAFT